MIKKVVKDKWLVTRIVVLERVENGVPLSYGGLFSGQSGSGALS